MMSTSTVVEDVEEKGRQLQVKIKWLSETMLKHLRKHVGSCKVRELAVSLLIIDASTVWKKPLNFREDCKKT